MGWVDTPVQHPERAAIFSNYRITAALAGVEISPLALTVITLLGELMYREAWHAAVHGVAESQTRLSD